MKKQAINSLSHIFSNKIRQLVARKDHKAFQSIISVSFYLCFLVSLLWFWSFSPAPHQPEFPSTPVLFLTWWASDLVPVFSSLSAPSLCFSASPSLARFVFKSSLCRVLIFLQCYRGDHRAGRCFFLQESRAVSWGIGLHVFLSLDAAVLRCPLRVYSDILINVLACLNLPISTEHKVQLSLACMSPEN